ncbi:MAG: 4a-hydroxytetrahydrobiopterin dehydratase [Alphaproteobacteria bacterium]|nr:4a-hydroxytetrahydrobiopterin dehydratase [Alphaproteobacteria bacterium]
MSQLQNKHCVPCQGGTPPLNKDEIGALLSQVGANWQINEKGHVFKSFKFKNFMEAMTFAHAIADLAEQEGHHPDLMISWGQCSVEIWTHKINGLTESDFILAAKIEALPSKTS